MDNEFVTMPDLAMINKAALWLGYFRKLCDQGMPFDEAMAKADERFGFTPPEGSLSKELGVRERDKADT